MRSNTARGGRRLGWRASAVLVTLAMVAAACGSRLPDEVLASIDEAALGQGSGAGPGRTGGGSGAVDGAGDGADSGAVAGGTGGGADGGTDGSSGAGGAGGSAAGSSEGSDAASDPSCRGGATDTGVTADEIVVANMSTDSGPLPGATAGSFRGTAAYFAKVNAEGGVCGRQIKVLKGDDGLDPQRGRAEFLRLEPQVVAFVGSLAVADSGYVDLVGSTGVPYIGTFVEPAGREFPNALPRTLANSAHTGPFEYYRKKHPGLKKVGFLYADIGGVRANTPASREPLKKVGFEIVYDSGAQVTSPDFTPEVLNMQRNGVEMVYLFAFEVNMHVRLARNMRQQNFEPKAKVSQIGYNSRLTDLLGDIANGWSNHITYAPMLNADEPARNPDLAEFLKWSETTFPGGQIDLFPVGSWGDADLFVKALRSLGPDVTREGIVDAINGMKEHDGGGIEAPINPSSGASSGCFVVVEVKDRKWVREHPARDYDCDLGESMTY